MRPTFQGLKDFLETTLQARAKTSTTSKATILRFFLDATTHLNKNNFVTFELHACSSNAPKSLIKRVLQNVGLRVRSRRLFVFSAVVITVVSDVTRQSFDDRSMTKRRLFPAFFVERLKTQDFRQLEVRGLLRGGNGKNRS